MSPRALRRASAERPNTGLLIATMHSIDCHPAGLGLLASLTHMRDGLSALQAATGNPATTTLAEDLRDLHRVLSGLATCTPLKATPAPKELSTVQAICADDPGRRSPSQQLRAVRGLAYAATVSSGTVIGPNFWQAWRSLTNGRSAHWRRLPQEIQLSEGWLLDRIARESNPDITRCLRSLLRWLRTPIASDWPDAEVTSRPTKNSSRGAGRRTPAVPEEKIGRAHV